MRKKKILSISLPQPSLPLLYEPDAKLTEGNIMTFNYIQAVADAQEAAENYYNGVSDMSDDQYDYLLEEIKEYEIANPEEVIQHGLFDEVAAGMNTDNADVPHDPPMLSLSKVNNLEDMSKFLAKNSQQNILVEPKLDGTALVLHYENGKLSLAATRGDGQYGEDMTSRVFKHQPQGVPFEVPYSGYFQVRGELYMTHEDLEKTNQVRQQWEDDYLSLRNRKTRNTWDYPLLKNARNGVSGAFRADNEDKVSRDKDNNAISIPAPKAFMRFAVYDVLLEDSSSVSYSGDLDWIEEIGFTTARSLIPEGVKKEIDPIAILQGLEAHRSVLPYPIDGCVFKIDSLSERNIQGVSSRAPRWAMAYKYPNETAITRVVNIKPSVGRTGRLALTAEVEKAHIDGSDITKASVHNVDWLLKKGIRIGDTVILAKANDVIPQIEEVVLSKRPTDSQPWEPPTACVKCGQDWNKDTLIWRCENPECSVQGSIEYAASRTIFDWDGFATKLITELVNSGRLNDIADVFTLTVEEIADTPMRDDKGEPRFNKEGELIVWGENRAKKIHKRIQDSKNTDLSKVIASLNVRMLGRTYGRRLSQKFHTMSKIQSLTLEDWLSLSDMGIAEKKAHTFHQGILDRAPLIKKLEEVGVNMGTEEDENVSSQALEGLKIVVTGSMKGTPLQEYKRDQMIELIESHGGKSSNSVSSSTSILVCGEEGSSKWKKAKDLGITILSPAEFAERIGL